METRVFDAPISVFSIDGSQLETFNSGERVKNVHRFGGRVIFEPASPNRVAGTYAMDLSEFEKKTTMVRQAHV
jgi:hypothetical protein